MRPVQFPDAGCIHFMYIRSRDAQCKIPRGSKQPSSHFQVQLPDALHEAWKDVWPTSLEMHNFKCMNATLVGMRLAPSHKKLQVLPVSMAFTAPTYEFDVIIGVKG